MPLLDELKTIETEEAAEQFIQKNWTLTIPKDYRENPNVAKYKTPDEFVKGHLSAVETIGKKGVIIPGDGASEDEVNRFQMSLGRPEKPDGYKFEKPEKLHPSIKPTPEFENDFKQRMFKNGASAKQAGALYQEYLSTVSQAMEKSEAQALEATKKAETGLRQEWGKDYDGNIKLATRFVEKLGGKDAVSDFGDLGRKPNVLRVLAKAGKMMSEDSMQKIGFSPLAVGADQAKQKIEEIKGDPKHPYWNEKDPKHNAAVREVRELYKVAEEKNA